MQERYSTPASRPPKRQHALTINLPQLPVFCHPRRPSVHLLANSCHSQIDIHWTSTFEWFGVRPMTRVGRRKWKLGLLATPAVTRRGLMGLPRGRVMETVHVRRHQNPATSLAEMYRFLL